LFVDDSALYKGGRNIRFLYRALQTDLNVIQSWCNIWGFKISLEKTVAVRYSNSNQIHTQLQIQGTPIKTVLYAKFLGVYFDKRLTWKQHIDHLINKCKKRLNLMRAVSGSDWGASNNSLLTIYRTLIRSILDYGATAYDSATDTQLTRLDRVQHSALSLCCGAMKGTPTSALEVECREAPLRLRRLQQQIKFAIKVKATPNHVASTVLREHWTTYYGNYHDNNRPFALKVRNFFHDMDTTTVVAPLLSDIPPWLMCTPETDITLSSTVSKKDHRKFCQHLLETLLTSAMQAMFIYTDASITSSGRAGIGCYIQSNSVTLEIEEAARITDGVTILAADMTSIKSAFYKIQLLQKTTCIKFAVFTDSLNTIALFSVGQCQLMILLHGIKSQVVLVWIPSHIGIPGNERADKLAALGAQRETVDVNIGLELQEA